LVWLALFPSTAPSASFARSGLRRLPRTSLSEIDPSGSRTPCRLRLFCPAVPTRLFPPHGPEVSPQDGHRPDLISLVLGLRLQFQFACVTHASVSSSFSSGVCLDDVLRPSDLREFSSAPPTLEWDLCSLRARFIECYPGSCRKALPAGLRPLWHV